MHRTLSSTTSRVCCMPEISSRRPTSTGTGSDLPGSSVTGWVENGIGSSVGGGGTFPAISSQSPLTTSCTHFSLSSSIFICLHCFLLPTSSLLPIRSRVQALLITSNTMTKYSTVVDVD